MQSHPLTVSDSAMALLEQYAWPGNVRELKHAVDRMVLLSMETHTVSRAAARAAIDSGSELGALKDDQMIREEARRSLLEVLETSAWSAEHAAVLLGVHRATVYRRMRREGISRIADRQTPQLSEGLPDSAVLD